MRKRLLLLSAYDAQSHRQWRLNLEDLFANYDWTQLTLPPRHFNWRIRGNSLSWGFGNRNCLSEDFDLLIATSMVDLSSLRGFIPSLAKIPSIVYFHENQFAYPLNKQIDHTQQTALVEAQITSIYSALCADSIVFNSHTNKKSFLIGAQKLLKKLPDFVPEGIVEHLQQASVIPVPIQSKVFEFPKKESFRHGDLNILNVAWNHRWEYDKGPGLLLKLVESVCRDKLPIKFFLFGQQFRHQPDEFFSLEKVLKDYGTNYPPLKAHIGFVTNPDDYYSLLSTCDVVLSTSLHDFQGLAILEACGLGCTPLVPSALAYPEYFDKQFMYSQNQELDDSICVVQIINKLKKWLALKAKGKALPTTDINNFSPEVLKKDYLALFEKLFRKPNDE